MPDTIITMTFTEEQMKTIDAAFVDIRKINPNVLSSRDLFLTAIATYLLLIDLVQEPNHEGR